MKLPLIGQIPNRVLDERFLEHRRRSSTFGLMAGALVSGGLAEYRILHDHRIDWDLFAVLFAMVLAKLTAFAWFRLHD